MSVPPPQWQFVFSAYMSAVSGSISVLSSSLIIYRVLGSSSRKNQLRKPHMRLLLGMSLWDFWYSLFKAQSWWTSPPESGWLDATGTMATCRLQGFFITFAHATGSYNAMLSTYYWLSICRGVKKERWLPFEIAFHITITVVFLSLATIGVFLKVYNPIFAFCYIQSFPPGCELTPESPPCQRWPPDTLGWMHQIWGQGAVQVSILVVILTNYLIWRRVQKQGRTMDRYSSFRGEALGEEPSLALGSQQFGTKGANPDARARRERLVFVQCLLYSVAFVLCFIGPTIFHLTGWFWGRRQFWHIGVLSAFTPLQGFFNAIIYARPIFIRIREKTPNVGRFEALRRVFFAEDPLGCDSLPTKRPDHEQTSPTRSALNGAVKTTGKEVHSDETESN